MFKSFFRNHDLPMDKFGLADSRYLFNFIYSFVIFLPLFFYTKIKKSDQGIFSRESTDVLKGVAILAIIIHHFAIHTLSKPSEILFYPAVGTVAVCAFLFASGFGLSKSLASSGLQDFFSKRFKRIFIPFLIFNFIWLVLFKLTGYANVNIIQWPNFIFGLNQIDRNYWYFYFTFFWYIIFFVIEKLFGKWQHKNYLYIALPVLILFFKIGYFQWHQLVNIFSFPVGVLVANYQFKVENFLEKKLNAWYIFLVGIFLYLVKICAGLSVFKDSIPIIGLTMFIILLLCLSMLIFKKYQDFILATLISLIAVNYFDFSVAERFSENLLSLTVVIGFLAVYGLLMKNKYSVVFRFLGTVSFELFLIHGALMYSFDFILFRLPIVISFALYLLAITGLAFATQKFFKLIRIY